MSKPDSKVQLHVSNLPAGTTRERLEAAFKHIGEIVDAFIPHRGSRFGFVEFKQESAADKGLGMDGKYLDEESKKESLDEKIGVIRAKVREGAKPTPKVPGAKEKDSKQAPKEGAGRGDKKESDSRRETKEGKARDKGKGKGESSSGKGGDRGPKQEKGERSGRKGGDESRSERASKGGAPKAWGPGSSPPTGQAGSGYESTPNKVLLDRVADSFFLALSQGDWEAAQSCFAPNAECFSPQRSGAKPQAFIQFRKTMGGMIGLLGKPKYLHKQRLYGIDSLTEQHTTKFEASPETAVEAEACVILRVNAAGLIVRMDEYLDPTAVLKAVQTAASTARK